MKMSQMPSHNQQGGGVSEFFILLGGSLVEKGWEPQMT